MTATFAVGRLVTSANSCAMTHAMSRQQLDVQLQGIYVSDIHKGSSNVDSYIKVFVDGHEIHKTHLVLGNPSPSWTFDPPFSMQVYPSSEIELSLYVHHALQRDTRVSNLTGTVWNFLYDEGVLLSNEARFHDVKMSVSVDVQESNLEHAPKELHEIARHLGWQSARTSQVLAAKTMTGPLKYHNEVLEYVEDILNVLSDLSPIFYGCKIAIALIKVVKKMLETQKEIHVAIGNMLRCLREVTAKALASCGARPIPGALLACRRIIKVAGKSAEVVDRWIHSAFKTQISMRNEVQEQIKHLQDELEDVQKGLHFNLDLALCQLASNSMPSRTDAIARPSAPPNHIAYASRQHPRGNIQNLTPNVRSASVPIPPPRYLRSYKSVPRLPQQESPSSASSRQSTLYSGSPSPISPTGRYSLLQESYASSETGLGLLMTGDIARQRHSPQPITVRPFQEVEEFLQASPGHNEYADEYEDSGLMPALCDGVALVPTHMRSFSRNLKRCA